MYCLIASPSPQKHPRACFSIPRAFKIFQNRSNVSCSRMKLAAYRNLATIIERYVYVSRKANRVLPFRTRTSTRYEIYISDKSNRLCSLFHLTNAVDHAFLFCSLCRQDANNFFWFNYSFSSVALLCLLLPLERNWNTERASSG